MTAESGMPGEDSLLFSSVDSLYHPLFEKKKREYVERQKFARSFKCRIEGVLEESEGVSECESELVDLLEDRKEELGAVTTFHHEHLDTLRRSFKTIARSRKKASRSVHSRLERSMASLDVADAENRRYVEEYSHVLDALSSREKELQRREKALASWAVVRRGARTIPVPSRARAPEAAEDEDEGGSPDKKPTHETQVMEIEQLQVSRLRRLGLFHDTRTLQAIGTDAPLLYDAELAGTSLCLAERLISFHKASLKVLEEVASSAKRWGRELEEVARGKFERVLGVDPRSDETTVLVEDLVRLPFLTSEQKRIFGVPLDVVMDRQLENETSGLAVPRAIASMLSYLGSRKALTAEFVLQFPGDPEEAAKIVLCADSGAPLTLGWVGIVHSVSSALKEYVRRLPPSFSPWEDFSGALEMEEKNIAVFLSGVFGKLSRWDTQMHYRLLSLFRAVVAKSDVNKMSVEPLANAWASTYFKKDRIASSSSSRPVSSAPSHRDRMGDVLVLLLQHFDTIWPSPPAVPVTPRRVFQMSASDAEELKLAIESDSAEDIPPLVRRFRPPSVKLGSSSSSHDLEDPDSDDDKLAKLPSRGSTSLYGRTMPPRSSIGKGRSLSVLRRPPPLPPRKKGAKGKARRPRRRKSKKAKGKPKAGSPPPRPAAEVEAVEVPADVVVEESVAPEPEPIPEEPEEVKVEVEEESGTEEVGLVDLDDIPVDDLPPDDPSELSVVIPQESPSSSPEKQEPEGRPPPWKPFQVPSTRISIPASYADLADIPEDELPPDDLSEIEIPPDMIPKSPTRKVVSRSLAASTKFDMTKFCRRSRVSLAPELLAIAGDDRSAFLDPIVVLTSDAVAAEVTMTKIIAMDDIVLTGDVSGAILLWPLEREGLPAEGLTCPEFAVHGPVICMVKLDTHHFICSGADSPTATIFKVGETTPVKILSGFTSPPNDAVVIEGFPYFVIIANRDMWLYKDRSGEFELVFRYKKRHRSRIKSVFSSFGRLYSISTDGVMCQWTFESAVGTTLPVKQGREKEKVMCGCPSQTIDVRVLTGVGTEGRFATWKKSSPVVVDTFKGSAILKIVELDPAKGTFVGAFDLGPKRDCVCVVTLDQGLISTVRFRRKVEILQRYGKPEEETFFVVDGSCISLMSGTSPERSKLKGHVEKINHVTPVFSGKYLASCSEDGTLRLWPTR